MNKLIIALAVGSAVILSGAAVAQPAVSDARCLVVSNIFANGAKDPKAKDIANSARLFYGGRLSARNNARVEREIATQMKQITGANAGPIMNACAQAMSRSLATLEAAGRRSQTGKQ
jgi:hypothetical protein